MQRIFKSTHCFGGEDEEQRQQQYNGRRTHGYCVFTKSSQSIRRRNAGSNFFKRCGGKNAECMVCLMLHYTMQLIMRYAIQTMAPPGLTSAFAQAAPRKHYQCIGSLVPTHFRNITTQTRDCQVHLPRAMTLDWPSNAKPRRIGF